MGKFISNRERAEKLISELRINPPTKNGVLLTWVLYEASHDKIMSRVIRMSPQTLGSIVWQAFWGPTELGSDGPTTILAIKQDFREVLGNQADGRLALRLLACLAIMAAMFDVFLDRNEKRQESEGTGIYAPDY